MIILCVLFRKYSFVPKRPLVFVCLFVYFFKFEARRGQWITLKRQKASNFGGKNNKRNEKRRQNRHGFCSLAIPGTGLNSTKTDYTTQHNNVRFKHRKFGKNTNGNTETTTWALFNMATSPHMSLPTLLHHYTYMYQVRFKSLNLDSKY